jgi:hypothetical protein
MRGRDTCETPATYLIFGNPRRILVQGFGAVPAPAHHQPRDSVSRPSQLSTQPGIRAGVVADIRTRGVLSHAQERQTAASPASLVTPRLAWSHSSRSSSDHAPHSSRWPSMDPPPINPFVHQLICFVLTTAQQSSRRSACPAVQAGPRHRTLRYRLTQ